MPGFQTKALVVTPFTGGNFRLILPIVWLVRHVCSDKAEFSSFFFAKEDHFLMQTYTKLMFGLSDTLVITVIARNRINSVGSLFFHDRVLRFSKNMPQSLKRFLSNFNVVAIQNSLDGFRNTLNVGNNSKTSRWFPLIGSATCCDWFSAVAEKGFGLAIRL